MNHAEAVLIDSREPDWVQKLTFGGIPTSVMFLEIADAHVVCSDGSILMVERKTPDDFLSSLRDERLLPQLTRMVEVRIAEQASNQTTTWPYLVITGELRLGPGGKVITSDRGATGWAWDAVQGALLTIQEMGAFVIFCDEAQYESCILRLAARPRAPLKLLPPKPPEILGAGAAFLAGLPGIGVERVMALMAWGNNCPADILAGLTDLEIQAPVGTAVRNKIRAMLGLKPWQRLAAPYLNANEQETLALVNQNEHN